MIDDLLSAEITKHVATLNVLDTLDLKTSALETLHGHTATVEQRSRAQLELTAAHRRLLVLEGKDPDQQVGARGMRYANEPYVDIDGLLVQPEDELTDIQKELLEKNAKWIETDIAAQKAQREAAQQDYADRRAAVIVTAQTTIDWAAARKQAAEEAAQIWARNPV